MENLKKLKDKKINSTIYQFQLNLKEKIYS